MLRLVLRVPRQRAASQGGALVTASRAASLAPKRVAWVRRPARL